MFIDQNILNIVARSSRMSEKEKLDMMQLYANLVMEAFMWAGAEYYITEKDMTLNTSKDVADFLDKMFEEISKEDNDKALVQKLHEAFDEVNSEAIKYFVKNGPPGDVLYLKVYLASNIDDWKGTKAKRKLINKVTKRELNLAKVPAKKNLSISKTSADSLNLLS